MSPEILEAAAKIANPYALMVAVVIAVLGVAGLVLKRRTVAGRHLDKIIMYSFFLAALIALLLFIPGLMGSIGESPETVRLEDTRIELSVRDEPLTRILEICAEQAGLVLAIDPNFDGSPTLTLASDGKLSGILDNVCQIGNCRWQIESGRKPVLFVRAVDTRPQAP